MRFLNKLVQNEEGPFLFETADQVRVQKIYEKHSSALRRYASRYLRTEGDISDIVQDVFMRISTMENISDIDADPLPYLITMTRNLIRDGYRKVAVRERYVDSVVREHKSMPLKLWGSNDQTPERILEGRQQLAQVAACVKKMPADIQRAFLLNRVKNMTYKEIADDMGVSERTVLRHVAQAISVIKSRLECG